MRRFFLSSLVCLVCQSVAFAQAADQKLQQQTVGYIKSLQAPSGGFLAEKPGPGGAAGKPTLRATSSAVRAIKYFHGEVPNKEAVIKFVDSCFDKATGGFTDTPGGKAETGTTSVGLMAVVDLGMPLDQYQAPAVKFLADNIKSFDEVRIAAAAHEAIKAPSPKLDEWLDLTAKLKVPPRSDNESDERSRVLAGQVVTLLRFGQKLKNPDTIVKDLQAGQHGSGGFGKQDAPRADLESTYRVMRAFVMLKAKPANVESLRNFVLKCRNEDHGFSVMPGESSSVSGTYFAGVILHWLDAKP